MSVSEENLRIHYDPEADILYISFGEPKPAEGLDIGDGTILRADPETNEAVGLTILNFSKRLDGQEIRMKWEKVKLDSCEQEIENSLEKAERVENFEEWKALVERAAEETVKLLEKKGKGLCK